MTDKEIAAFCLRCTKDSLDCPLAAGDYDKIMARKLYEKLGPGITPDPYIMPCF